VSRVATDGTGQHACAGIAASRHAAYNAGTTRQPGKNIAAINGHAILIQTSHPQIKARADRLLAVAVRI
jgi:hypothetical protein